ncbi:MAG TPA: glycosyltransferase [Planctomycetota bacterium]|jgi:glycosyltransferase involved in cell wall biosynthesis|nr:glycosyltransferase [Planctomycetota bacterium]
MISFVVPAYDEELLLGATLAAIRRAADACGEAHEIVVADDASSDRTAEVAERRGARVVRVAHRQIAATRNSGARAARGELLVFVDADTLIDADVLRAALAALRSGAVGGGCAVRFDGSVPAYARIVTPLLVASFRTLGFACGCFVFCTRAAFEATGGFDEKLFGAEELAFSRALARLGRFVVLRECVATSGRKMRTHTGWEILGALGKLAIRGPRSVRRREGMEFWYGKRRVELAE